MPAEPCPPAGEHSPHEAGSAAGEHEPVPREHERGESGRPPTRAASSPPRDRAAARSGDAAEHQRARRTEPRVALARQHRERDRTRRRPRSGRAFRRARTPSSRSVASSASSSPRLSVTRMNDCPKTYGEQANSAASSDRRPKRRGPEWRRSSRYSTSAAPYGDQRPRRLRSRHSSRPATSPHAAASRWNSGVCAAG